MPLTLQDLVSGIRYQFYTPAEVFNVIYLSRTQDHKRLRVLIEATNRTLLIPIEHITDIYLSFEG